jgi:toxin ParE1/3/4
MRAHFTPQAEIDLEEVGDYIALDNPGRAVSFIREIRQHCEKIADGPHPLRCTMPVDQVSSFPADS